MDATALLSEYDFIVVIDASASMGTEDMGPKGDKSRWKFMQETAEGFTREVEKIDSDGLGLVVFSGSGIDSRDGVKTKDVSDVFRSRSPRSSTPMAEALQAALKLAGKSDKKDFILVFTDGEPDDKDAVAKVIIDASQKLTSDDQLTFLFVQVGHDAGATSYLRQLDDNLRGAKFDIVDTKTIEEAEKFNSVVELVVAAIND